MNFEPPSITVAGSTASITQASLQSAINQLTNYINTVSNTVNQQDNRNAIIRQQMPLASDVAAGDLVAWDSTSSTLTRALAALTTPAGSIGESIEAPSSRIVGMVVSVDSTAATVGSGSTPGNTGTVLLAGYYCSTSIAQNCLGINATSGTYYLSNTNAGKATKNPGHIMTQPALTYLGDGRIIIHPNYMAHDNHFHSSKELYSGNFTAEHKAIAGYIYEYKFALDSTSSSDAAFGPLSSATTAIFDENGTLVNTPASYVIDDTDGVLRAAALPTGRVTLFNHYPWAYGSAVVRNVQAAEGSDITIQQENGTVTITPHDFEDQAIEDTDTAVSIIKGNKVYRSSLVSGAEGGLGINVAKLANGHIVISDAKYLDNLIDAVNINCNGTLFTADSRFVYLTFPANRADINFIMSSPLPSYTTLQNYEVLVWAITAGSATQLTASAKFLATPSINTPTDIPGDFDAPVTFPLSGAAGKFTYNEVLCPATVVSSSGGMLMAKIKLANAGNQPINILRCGFRLRPASTTSTGSAYGEYTTSGVTIDVTSGDSGIELLDCIRINASGAAVRCPATVLDNINKCVGICVGLGNSTIKYMAEGVITSSSIPTLISSQRIGYPVYISNTGKLLQLADGEPYPAGIQFIQKVGTLINATTLQVHVEAGFTFASAN